MPLNWQQQLREAFTDIRALFRFLQIDPRAVKYTEQTPFRVKVPRCFAERMEKGNPSDPLFSQIVPLHQETLDQPGFLADPVGDHAAQKTPVLLHKYQGRALLLSSAFCAIHCRFCFRREFPYSTSRLNQDSLKQSVHYLNTNPDISEIILSGGDPLMLENQRLFEIIHQLESIAHLKRLRIHTRMPVILPDRIDHELLQGLQRSRFAVVVVTHCNHANEIDNNVKNSMALLKQAGIHLLNQSVLLRNVNDSAAALAALSERLFESGISPYYLHLLDRTRGTHHFEVNESEARKLIELLRQQLPGYLVPKLVREEAGKPSKTTLA